MYFERIKVDKKATIYDMYIKYIEMRGRRGSGFSLLLEKFGGFPDCILCEYIIVM